MKHTKLLGLAAFMLLAAGTANAAWTGENVGTPTLAGSAVSNPDGTITLTGGGDDIWGNSDNFFFYYQPVTGPMWDAVVKVQSLNGPDWWTKCDLMARRPETLGGPPAGNDPHFSIMVTRTAGQNQLGPQLRGTRAGGSDDNGGQNAGAPPYPNAWLRLQRFGSVFTMYKSTDGVAWTQVFSKNTSTGGNGFDGVSWEDTINVGVAVTAHNNADTTGGVAVISDLGLTIHTPIAPTAATILTQPTNFTAYLGSEASFTCVATNNGQPGLSTMGMNYKWYKNNVLVSTNNMGPRYTFLTTAADAGAQVHCVANIIAPYDAITVTSDTVALTVNPAVTYYTNGLKREIFYGGSRVGVEIGSVAPATWLDVRGTMDDRGGYGDNYAQRVSGWFKAPTTANYVFWVAADDDTDVFLSTDSTVANKQQICQENGWSPALNWAEAGGANAIDTMQKCSTTWSPDGGITTPWTAGIPLTEGNLYYIEAVMHQGTGGDNFAITYALTTDPAAVNGDPSRMTNNLQLVSWAPTTIAFTTSPTNKTVFEGFAATFEARAANDGEFRSAYQWYKNGSAVAGATTGTYSINPATPADNGDQIYVVASTYAGGLSITSSIVSLTVQQSVFERSVVKNELWRGIQNRDGVKNGTVGPPTYTTTSPKFEAAINNACGNNYTRKVSGYFIPPTTGDYVFFTCADDTSDLYLSTDDSTANIRLIAQETTWSNPFQWLTSGGGSVLAQKRSDSWSPNNDGTMPYSAGFRLNAGQRYYMQVIQAEGSGGDNVEVTYKFLADADPLDGADTKIAGNAIGMKAIRANWVNFTTQPTNTTADTMSFVKFYVAGNTDSPTPIGQTTTDGENDYTNVFIQVQWQKNGIDIPGAVSPTLTVGPVTQVDNGAVFTCKIRALGYVDNMTSQTPIWSNSQPATLTLSGPQYVWEPGWAQVEFWNSTINPSRTTIEAGNAGTPSYVTTSPQFAEKTTGGDPPDNYGSRIIGWFIPPTSGSYVFFMNSDDDGDLFLSTDSSAVNKRLIARETGWSSTSLGWNVQGGTAPAGRRSDQYYGTINLTGGQKYYMEGVYHEGGGGDYFAATYILSGDADPVAGDQPKITGSTLGTYVKRANWVNFTAQPASVVAGSGAPVAFTAAATSDQTVSVGVTGAPRTNVFVMYQWQKNGSDIPGATDGTLVYVPTGLSDNGAQFVCKTRALGYVDASLNVAWSNSATAVLSINDTTAPTLAYSGYFVNTNFVAAAGGTNAYIVDVVFSERMDVASLASATYTIPGATILNKVVNSTSENMVELQLSAALALPKTVSVTGAKDFFGNTIAAGASIAVGATLLNGADIGTPGVDPAFPSSLWVTGPQGYTAVAQGSDLWATADGFNFLYETKPLSADFDMVVMTKSLTPTSRWAKSGLMVRESLDPSSRNWNIINSPAPVPTVDNNSGINTVEGNARIEYMGQSAGWDTGTRPAPTYPTAWVRLKKQGQILTAYCGSDGQTWVQRAQTDVSTNATGGPLVGPLLIGICTTAHNNDPVGNAPPYQFYATAEYENYTSSYVLAPPRPTITATYNPTTGNMTVSWAPAGGHLESKTAIDGATWTTVPGGTANPSVIPANGPSMFFRVVNP